MIFLFIKLITNGIGSRMQMGGNKGRKQGRKHMTVPSASLRVIEEEDERYAMFTKLYGGSNAEVVCDDGVTRRCVIRNKFRGRHKRDNMVSTGVICLVGLRSWESKSSRQAVDLLHIYTSDHRIRLFKEVAIDWSWATGEAYSYDAAQSFQFSEATERISDGCDSQPSISSPQIVTGEDHIDVDDI